MNSTETSHLKKKYVLRFKENYVDMLESEIEFVKKKYNIFNSESIDWMSLDFENIIDEQVPKFKNIKKTFEEFKIISKTDDENDFTEEFSKFIDEWDHVIIHIIRFLKNLISLIKLQKKLFLKIKLLIEKNNRYSKFFLRFTKNKLKKSLIKEEKDIVFFFEVIKKYKETMNKEYEKLIRLKQFQNYQFKILSTAVTLTLVPDGTPFGPTDIIAYPIYTLAGAMYAYNLTQKKNAKKLKEIEKLRLFQ